MADSKTKPGFMVSGILLAVALVVTIVAAIIIISMAVGSEEAGINAALACALPFGAAWGAALASVIVHFAVPHRSLARWLVPLGGGLAGGIGLLAVLAAFFLLLFPEL